MGLKLNSSYVNGLYLRQFWLLIRFYYFLLGCDRTCAIYFTIRCNLCIRNFYAAFNFQLILSYIMLWNNGEKKLQIVIALHEMYIKYQSSLKYHSTSLCSFFVCIFLPPPLNFFLYFDGNMNIIQFQLCCNLNQSSRSIRKGTSPDGWNVHLQEKWWH